MSLSLYPVKIEIYDVQEHVAIVEMFDETSANVTISTVVNVNSWPEILWAIHEALKSMRQQGDQP